LFCSFCSVILFALFLFCFVLCAATRCMFKLEHSSQLIKRLTLSYIRYLVCIVCRVHCLHRKN
jgi:hypothetical protein